MKHVKLFEEFISETDELISEQIRIKIKGLSSADADKAREDYHEVANKKGVKASFRVTGDKEKTISISSENKSDLSSLKSIISKIATKADEVSTEEYDEKEKKWKSVGSNSSNSSKPEHDSKNSTDNLKWSDAEDSLHDGGNFPEEEWSDYYKSLYKAALKKIGADKMDDVNVAVPQSLESRNEIVKKLKDAGIPYAEVKDEKEGGDDSIIWLKDQKNKKTELSPLVKRVVNGIKKDYGTTTEDDLDYALDDYLHKQEIDKIDMTELIQALKDRNMLEALKSPL
jgi:hypothetical protein